MAEPAPNAELLSSLGRLVRGLSALFWGLPIALVVCVQAAKGEWLRPLGIFPPLLATGLLCYGVDLLGHFQKQERIWRAALDRTRLFALINFGLSPFLYWWNKIPSQPFYNTMIDLMTVTALMFLLALNPMLHRLAAMLPDETLRGETNLFTRLNQVILLILMTALPFHFLLHSLSKLPRFMVELMLLLDRGGPMLELMLLMIFILVPVAMTMALLWKTKETIMNGVFSNVSGVEPPGGS